MFQVHQPPRLQISGNQPGHGAPAGPDGTQPTPHDMAARLPPYCPIATFTVTVNAPDVTTTKTSSEAQPTPAEPTPTPQKNKCDKCQVLVTRDEVKEHYVEHHFGSAM